MLCSAIAVPKQCRIRIHKSNEFAYIRIWRFNLSFMIFFIAFELDFDTEKTFAYRAASESFLSMGPHLAIPMPGSTESWWLSSL